MVDDQQSAPAQFPVDKCHAIIGDYTYADAILDRIVHNAHCISPRCGLWAQGGDLNSSSTRCQPAPCQNTRAGRAQAGVLNLRVD